MKIVAEKMLKYQPAAGGIGGSSFPHAKSEAPPSPKCVVSAEIGGAEIVYPRLVLEREAVFFLQQVLSTTKTRRNSRLS
jgi:hypothetical protein